MKLSVNERRPEACRHVLSLPCPGRRTRARFLMTLNDTKAMEMMDMAIAIGYGELVQ